MSFKLDDRAFQGMLKDLGNRDIRIAATWALNDTAADVLQHQQDRMDTVFDRPTRFTKNAFMVWRAKPSDLEAQVLERPSVGKRHYLKVQEEGGPRDQTGVEKLMQTHVAYDGVLRAVIPGDNARLDAHGNWSSGERNQVLSMLGAQRDRAANTPAKMRRATKARAKYFVPKSGLYPGVYSRDAAGNLGVVAIFTSSVPTYSPRLGFYDGAEQIYRAKLPDHLSRTIAKMVAKRSGGGPP